MCASIASSRSILEPFGNGGTRVKNRPSRPVSFIFALIAQSFASRSKPMSRRRNRIHPSSALSAIRMPATLATAPSAFRGWISATDLKM
jgi:hypothetical protein